MTPYYKQTDDGDYMSFPCGKCPPCLKRRASGWSFRLMQEDKYSLSSMFVTLTYNTSTVPITKNGFMSLKKRDMQLFFKRLRKISQYKIKYYAVGEYGGKTMRPHYHLIIFNTSASDIINAWTLNDKPIGDVHFGNVSGASVGYCLKYMMKESKIPIHYNDDRIQEFSLMSKGIGKTYLTDAMIKWHHAKICERLYLVIEDGKKIAMPRYYKNKIYDENQRAHIGQIVAPQVRLRAEIVEHEMLHRYGEDYHRMKIEYEKNSFKKMYRNAEKNRTI